MFIAIYSYVCFCENIIFFPTSIKKFLEKKYYGKKKDFENFWTATLEEINVIYERKAEMWEDEMLNLLTKKAVTTNFINQDHPGEKNKRAGFLNYEFGKGKIGYEKFGIDRMDSLIEIHFEEAYLQDGSLNLGKSLEELAKKIIEEYPETQYIVGRSWILDHKISQRIGFEIMERTEGLNNFSTWYQLMDKDGQINEKRLARFERDGRLPFQVALGIIPVEKFLELYLPDEMRGKIKLKEIRKEERERAKNLRKLGEVFEKKFKQMSREEAISFFKKTSLLDENFKNNELKEYLNFLYDAREQGIDLADIGKHYLDKIEAFKKNMERKFLATPTEKEIFIGPKKFRQQI
jgi:hypothetical protein